MLNFSKINVINNLFVIFLLSFFSILNFQKNDKFINKKVNLGLDLQGGSYFY